MKDDEFKEYMRNMLEQFKNSERKAQAAKNEKKGLPDGEHVLDFSFLKISEFKETVVWSDLVKEEILFNKKPL